MFKRLPNLNLCIQSLSHQLNKQMPFQVINILRGNGFLFVITIWHNVAGEHSHKYERYLCFGSIIDQFSQRVNSTRASND